MPEKDIDITKMKFKIEDAAEFIYHVGANWEAMYSLRLLSGGLYDRTKLVRDAVEGTLLSGDYDISD